MNADEEAYQREGIGWDSSLIDVHLDSSAAHPLPNSSVSGLSQPFVQSPRFDSHCRLCGEFQSSPTFLTRTRGGVTPPSSISHPARFPIYSSAVVHEMFLDGRQ
jgi:hypothetical protein